MSDSREQSYYEIALTNRQVMTIFVVLLVCVLAAFLGGVWVGRGDEVTVTTIEPEAIASGVRPGDPPLEELDFFSQSGTPESTAAEVREPEAERPEPAVVAESAQPIILEEIGGRARAESPPEEAVRSPAAESPAATSPPASAPTQDLPALLGEALVVQVFSSTDQQQASRVLERVRAGGYQAVISSVDVDGRATYRVRVGPYTEREEAQKVADRIRRTYKLETWITH